MIIKAHSNTSINGSYFHFSVAEVKTRLICTKGGVKLRIHAFCNRARLGQSYIITHPEGMSVGSHIQQSSL